jgi:hypothetical protein
MNMFYYLISLLVIIVILIIFNNRAMSKIRKQEDIIDDLTMTIANFPTREQEEDRFKKSQRKHKEEYLQLNWSEMLKED